MMVFRLFAAALVLGSGPAFAAGNFQRLYSNDAEASSFLQNDWNKYSENYHPNYALDDDPKTAWVEGAPGNGEGESLTIRFSVLKSARTVRVRIRNGYQRSKALLAANAAPKEVTLSLLNAAGEVVFSQKASLTKAMDWQQVDLAPPAKAQLAFLKLRIDSTWPGSQYKDTCISDVQLLVDSDVPYNAKAEQAKKAALAAWIQDRWATAKYFAALPKTYPFAATHFDARTEFDHSDLGTTGDDTGDVKERQDFTPLERLVEKGSYPAAWKKLFDQAQTTRIRRLMEIAKEHGASLGKAWYRPVFTGHIRLPDGLPSELAPAADFLDRQNFALFEASQATASPPQHNLSELEALVESGAVHKSETTQVRVEFDVPPTAASAGNHVETAPLHVKEGQRVHALYFWERTIYGDREIEEAYRDVLFCFDEQERPSELLILSTAPDWGITVISFERDAKGRVAKVTSRSAKYSYPEFGDESNEFKATTYTPTSQG